MKRVFIVGSGGSGKTTLANHIASSIGSSATQLDALYWQDHWVPAAIEDFERDVAEVTSKSTWVIDGNYRGTVFDKVLHCSDTLIWLNLPRWLVLWRCLKRDWQMIRRGETYFGKECPPSLSGSLGLLSFVYRTYDERNRVLKAKAEEALVQKKKVAILCSSKEVDQFIEGRLASSLNCNTG